MEKINIAELLKDCPRGMELDCTVCDNATVECVFDGDCFPIQIQTPEGNMWLSKYGCMSLSTHAKCIIFPKGKTTWDGFVPPCMFKDGDVVATTDGSWIGIVVGGYENELIPTYCVIKDNEKFEAYFNKKGIWAFDRLATEEEKQKLFDVIKENGYKWNAETKTLKKLIEPKFKVEDTIQDADGYKVEIYKVDIDEECYEYISIIANGIGSIPFEQQDKWELVPNKFDITTLKPFDKVLVRDNDEQMWTADIFSFYNEKHVYPFMCAGHYTNQCIPFEGNEHLLGKTDDCDEYYKTWE